MAPTPQQSRSTNRKPAGAASRSRAGSASRTTKPSAARKPSASARTASTQRKPAASAASNGTLDSARNTAAKLAKPALAGGVAVAGIVGAVLRAKTTRKRRFPASIGNPLSGIDMKKARKQLEGLDIKKARKQVGRASKQFGELTRELRKAGEQAERIGDALS
jgi:hypothetical protein